MGYGPQLGMYTVVNISHFCMSDKVFYPSCWSLGGGVHWRPAYIEQHWLIRPSACLSTTTYWHNCQVPTAMMDWCTIPIQSLTLSAMPNHAPLVDLQCLPAILCCCTAFCWCAVFCLCLYITDNYLGQHDIRRRHLDTVCDHFHHVLPFYDVLSFVYSESITLPRSLWSIHPHHQVINGFQTWDAFCWWKEVDLPRASKYHVWGYQIRSHGLVNKVKWDREVDWSIRVDNWFITPMVILVGGRVYQAWSLFLYGIFKLTDAWKL